MSQVEDSIEKEIESLVELGKKIVKRAISLGSAMEGDELANVTSWVTRLGQLIRKLYGTNSQHFENYTKALNTKSFYFIHSNNSEHISQILGIAITVKHDYEHGLLNNIKALVQADIFSDFLEMGEYLLAEDYKDAAAVIIGAVLEDSLRKLCEKNEIPIIKENGKQLTIEPLNIALAKADIYSKLVQKQVTTWAHIRNKAAHGEYQEYDKNQTEMMLIFVQNFAEQYLT